MHFTANLLHRAQAGVPYKDDQGRQADFHALRKSFNTHLAQAAVDPQTRKEMMRHSELRLTTNIRISLQR